jgi:hypothetical protein
MLKQRHKQACPLLGWGERKFFKELSLLHLHTHGRSMSE